MRTVRIALFTILAISSTSAAWAQYGLYGSPETLSLPQQQVAPAMSVAPQQPPAMTAPQPTAPTYVASYPSTAPTAAPTYYQGSAQPYYPGSTQTYSPAQPQYGDPAQSQYGYPAQPQVGYSAQTQYRYPAQPQYRYPAQTPEVARYQPYQAGSQYRYPNPSPAMRAPARVAAAQPMAAPLQPIPAPPAAPAMPGSVAPQSQAAPQPQGSGVMNQMLAEQGNAGYDDSCGVYRGAVGQYQQAACNPQAEACGYDGDCAQAYCPWYASVSALVMGRSGGRRVWTSYEDGNQANQLANSQFDMPWRWGGEARFGRRFCCGCTPYALEGSFWSTQAFSGTQTTSLFPGGYVSTPLNTDNIFFGLGGLSVPAANLFDGARSHTLTRQDEFYNFELNLIREQLAWAYDSPWDIGWSVGVRYFRFQDSLMFGTVSHLGDADAYFKDTTTNNLVGVQFGFDAAYNVWRGIRLFVTPKVGIYDNFLDGNFQAKARAGAGSYVDGTVNVPGYANFPVSTTANGVAFLTQIDVGADWQFTRNWSARAGYRVVAVTGVGTADDQFPQFMCDTPDIANIQHTSSIVVHGAFLGLTYNF